jgi:hypothetical protein
MAHEKKYTAREAAIAVLAKAQEMLNKTQIIEVLDPKAALKKAENPDEKQDAKLGEDVEHLCEEHMMANKAAERKEGHKLVQKSNCMECNLVKPTPKSGQGDTLRRPANEAKWQMDKAELSGDLEKLEELFKAERKGGVDVGKESVGYKPSKLGAEEKDQEEPSDSAFEVKGKDSKSSDDKRLGRTDDPDKNPKERAEGNNAEPGSKPGVESHPGQDTPPIKGHHKLAKFIGRMEYKKSQAMPKSEEMAKGKREDYARSQSSKETGVHLPAKMEAPVYHQEGASRAGLEAKWSKKGPHKVARAKEEHQKVLSEMKAQPKPKLPR